MAGGLQSAFELPAPLVVDAPFLDSKDGAAVLFNNQAERHWALPFDASNLDKCPSHVVGDWPLKQRGGAQQCEPVNGLFQAAQVEINGYGRALPRPRPVLVRSRRVVRAVV